MGFWLHVELDCDERLVPDLAQWACKPLMYALAHEHVVFDDEPSLLDLAAERLGVDVGPLHKVFFGPGDFDLVFEAITPQDREAWARAERERMECEQRVEAIWQPPSDLNACVQRLLQALDAQPGVFEDLEVSQYIDGEYYLSGEFYNDLQHLGRIAAWAEANGVPRMRLLII